MAGKIPRTIFALVEPAVWSLAARLLILTTDRKTPMKLPVAFGARSVSASRWAARAMDQRDSASPTSLPARSLRASAQNAQGRQPPVRPTRPIGTLQPTQNEEATQCTQA